MKQMIKFDEPKEIFLLAESFLNSAYTLQNRCNPNNPNNKDFLINLLAVSNANHSFSCELYLKCLLCIENGEFETEHHLQKLYNSLSEERQKRIIEYHDKIASENDIKSIIEKELGIPQNRDFILALKANSLAFLDYRYFFDIKQERLNYDLSDIVLAVREVIREIHPEWPVLNLLSYM